MHLLEFFSSHLSKKLLYTLSIGVGVLLPIAVLRFYFKFSEQNQLTILGGWLYWVTSGISLGLLISISIEFFQWLRIKNRGFILLAGIIAAGTGLLLTNLIFERNTRVQWDESDLFQTSLAFHFSHNTLVPSQAIFENNRIVPVAFSLSKRPPLFSRISSFLHPLFGPAPENLLFTNQIVFFLLLVFIFSFTCYHKGILIGLSALLLALSNPLLLWVATSGGMDLLTATISLLGVVQCNRLWNNPKLGNYLKLLIIGLCISYTRYEGMGLFVILLAPCVVIFLKQKRNLHQFVFLTSLLPLLLLPVILLIFSPSHFQAESNGSALFSVSNVIPNFEKFFSGFFGSVGSGPYFPLVNIFGFLCLIIALVLRKLNLNLLPFAAVTSYYLMVNFFFFGGDAGRADTARLFLFPSITFSLLPLLFCFKLLQRPVFQKILLIFSVIFFLLVFTKYRGKNLFPEILDTAAAREFASLIKTENDKGHRNLYVFDPSGFPVSLGAAAVSTGFFSNNPGTAVDFFKLERGTAILWVFTGVEPKAPEYSNSLAGIQNHYLASDVTASLANGSSLHVYSLTIRNQLQ